MNVKQSRNRGQAMVEFAIIAFAMYLVLAIILTFGQTFFTAQVVQQASDSFAHELAETPLQPTATLLTPGTPASTDALPALAVGADGIGILPTTLTSDQQLVSGTLFNEALLQVNIQNWMTNANGQTLEQYLTDPNGEVKMPLINQLLIPVMTMEQRSGEMWLTYPGITLRNGHYAVPRLKNDGTFEWVSVIEALGASTAGDGTVTWGQAGFPLIAANGTSGGGIAGVRLNYGFHSSSLSAFDNRNDPVSDAYIEADAGDAADADFNNDKSPSGGLYGGANHLGVQAVGKLTVRPFQRVLTGQAAYRREVFAPPPTTPNGN